MIEAVRYCVRVTCKDGRTWIAHGANALPHFEQHRKSAVAYKNELLKHLDDAKCKVVRVRVTISEITEAGNE